VQDGGGHHLADLPDPDRPARPTTQLRPNPLWRRNVVERCVNRLKQWRSIATRFDKRAVNHRAAVVIVSLLLWLA
jgi:transposase